jgi:hypothetical protein
MTMELDGDHLMGLGQFRTRRGIDVDRHQPAMQEQQRRALSGDLVVVLETIDLRVSRLRGALCGDNWRRGCREQSPGNCRD